MNNQRNPLQEKKMQENELCSSKEISFMQKELDSLDYQINTSIQNFSFHILTFAGNFKVIFMTFFQQLEVEEVDPELYKQELTEIMVQIKYITQYSCEYVKTQLSLILSEWRPKLDLEKLNINMKKIEKEAKEYQKFQSEEVQKSQLKRKEAFDSFNDPNNSGVSKNLQQWYKSIQKDEKINVYQKNRESSSSHEKILKKYKQLFFNNFRLQQTASGDLYKLQLQTSLNLACPICPDILRSTREVFSHMFVEHNFKDFDRNYYCMYCNFKSIRFGQFLDSHLYRVHTETKSDRMKYYTDPFTKEVFNLQEKKNLKASLLYSTSYTKIIEQFGNIQRMMVKLPKPKKQQLNNFVESEKQIFIQNEALKRVYERGETPITQMAVGYQCPICWSKKSQTLRELANHISSKHGAKYPNTLFCPHCKLTFIKSQILAQHLLSVHNSGVSSSEPIYEFIGTKEKFRNINLLQTTILKCTAYFSFFNKEAPSQ